MTGPTDERLLDDDRAGDTEPDQPMLALLLAYQRRARQRGERSAVEAYVAQHPALAADCEAVLDLIYQEVLLRDEGFREDPVRRSRGCEITARRFSEIFVVE
jgi:hypothetical protein